MHSLVLQDISKRFATAEVLHSISFTVSPSQRVAVVGESGSGKTTLLRIVAGLEQPSAGRIRINDLDVTSWPANKRGIGVVFQDYATYPRLTVSENLTVSLVGGGITRDEKEKRLSEVCQWLGLKDLLKRLPTELSGGQLQRVAIGKVLMARPQVLLLDEPFSQLDVRLAEQMRRLLADCHERYGMTQISVTHDPFDALTAVDRLAVIHRGKLSQFASPEEVRENPRTLFAAQLTSPCGINVLPANLLTPNGPSSGKGVDPHAGLSKAEAMARAVMDQCDQADSEQFQQLGPAHQSIVGVRPESIRLHTCERPNDVALECRMHGLRDLGIVRLAELSVSGQRLKMQWPANVVPVCEGDRVNCVISRDDLMTFADEVGTS